MCMGVTYRKSADYFELSDVDRVASKAGTGEMRHRVCEYGFIKGSWS